MNVNEVTKYIGKRIQIDISKLGTMKLSNNGYWVINNVDSLGWTIQYYWDENHPSVVYFFTHYNLPNFIFID